MSWPPLQGLPAAMMDSDESELWVMVPLVGYPKNKLDPTDVYSPAIHIYSREYAVLKKPIDQYLNLYRRFVASQSRRWQRITKMLNSKRSTVLSCEDGFIQPANRCADPPS